MNWPFPSKAENYMNLFNEVLVSFYLYGYLYLTDFTTENPHVQDISAFGILIIMFLSIFVNLIYMAVNVIIVGRKSFLRWYYLDGTCCKKKKQALHPSQIELSLLSGAAD